MKIGIVGLGLIGGSFAKAIKKYTNHYVLAYDINEISLQSGLADKAIDGILKDEDLSKIDLLILALTPKNAIDYVKAHKNIRGNVMEICGVKRSVSKELFKLSDEYGFNYIGTHPMAGREVGGYENSLAELYQKASMIVIDHGHIDKWILDLFEDLGFFIEYSNDQNHDRIIAYTSQLAHVVSNSFVKSDTALEHKGYSADSLKDLTRVATIDEKMWTELFLDNADNLEKEIDNIIEELEKYKKAIHNRDGEELKRLLKEGSDRKALMYPKEDIPCKK